MSELTEKLIRMRDYIPPVGGTGDLSRGDRDTLAEAVNALTELERERDGYFVAYGIEKELRESAEQQLQRIREWAEGMQNLAEKKALLDLLTEQEPE